MWGASRGDVHVQYKYKYIKNVNVIHGNLKHPVI